MKTMLLVIAIVISVTLLATLIVLAFNSNGIIQSETTQSETTQSETTQSETTQSETSQPTQDDGQDLINILADIDVLLSKSEKSAYDYNNIAKLYYSAYGVRSDLEYVSNALQYFDIAAKTIRESALSRELTENERSIIEYALYFAGQSAAIIANHTADFDYYELAINRYEDSNEYSYNSRLQKDYFSAQTHFSYARKLKSNNFEQYIAQCFNAINCYDLAYTNSNKYEIFYYKGEIYLDLLRSYNGDFTYYNSIVERYYDRKDLRERCIHFLFDLYMSIDNPNINYVDNLIAYINDGHIGLSQERKDELMGRIGADSK